MGEPYKLTFADRSGVLLAVESESGICGTIEMEPYMNTDDWNESVFVGFEKGYIRVDLEAPLSDGFSKVYVMRDNGKEPATIIQPTMKRIPAMRNQAMNFIAAVKGIRPAPCLSEEAVLDLKIAKDYIDMMNSYR